MTDILSAQGLDFDFMSPIGERKTTNWVDVEMLAIDDGFEDRMIAHLDGDITEESPFFDNLDEWRLDEGLIYDMSDRDPYAETMEVTLNGAVIRVDDPRFSAAALRLAEARVRYEEESLVAELDEDSSVDFQSSFQNCDKDNLRLTYFEADDKFFRRHYWSERRGSGRQRAPKWQQACRTNRLAHTGNRQVFETMRDTMADASAAWEEILQKDAAIPEFEPTYVGLSEEEAAYFEREEREFVTSWEEEAGHYFDQVSAADALAEARARIRFPHRYEKPAGCRVSSMFEYDDWYFDSMDDYEPYGEETDDWRDEEEWSFFNQVERGDGRFDSSPALVADNDDDIDVHPAFVGRRSFERPARRYGLREWHEEATRLG